mgnify:CR=1 FL=1
MREWDGCADASSGSISLDFLCLAWRGPRGLTGNGGRAAAATALRISSSSSTALLSICSCRLRSLSRKVLAARSKCSASASPKTATFFRRALSFARCREPAGPETIDCAFHSCVAAPPPPLTRDPSLRMRNPRKSWSSCSMRCICASVSLTRDLRKRLSEMSLLRSLKIETHGVTG